MLSMPLRTIDAGSWVVRPLRWLVGDIAAFKGLVEQTLDAMSAHGDFLEHCDIEEDAADGTTSLLYAAPASFVTAREWHGNPTRHLVESISMGFLMILFHVSNTSTTCDD